MINYAELITALQGCELLPEQARQLERVLQEHARMRAALGSIERNAILSADPSAAHSAQISYDELLGGYLALADVARDALAVTHE